MVDMGAQDWAASSGSISFNWATCLTVVVGVKSQKPKSHISWISFGEIIWGGRPTLITYYRYSMEKVDISSVNASPHVVECVSSY